jgi:hypothetical protein
MGDFFQTSGHSEEQKSFQLGGKNLDFVFVSKFLGAKLCFFLYIIDV